jgi:hypothetical protein
VDRREAPQERIVRQREDGRHVSHSGRLDAFAQSFQNARLDVDGEDASPGADNARKPEREISRACAYVASDLAGLQLKSRDDLIRLLPLRARRLFHPGDVGFEVSRVPVPGMTVGFAGHCACDDDRRRQQGHVERIMATPAVFATRQCAGCRLGPTSHWGVFRNMLATIG